MKTGSSETVSNLIKGTQQRVAEWELESNSVDTEAIGFTLCSKGFLVNGEKQTGQASGQQMGRRGVEITGHLL